MTRPTPTLEDLLHRLAIKDDPEAADAYFRAMQRANLFDGAPLCSRTEEDASARQAALRFESFALKMNNLRIPAWLVVDVCRRPRMRLPMFSEARTLGQPISDISSATAPIHAQQCETRLCVSALANPSRGRVTINRYGFGTPFVVLRTEVIEEGT